LRPLRDAGGELANLSQAELVDLVQWTDLILFDYLTANFDRLVSNLFSLQWDPRVMARLRRLYRRHEPRFPELAALADPHSQLLQRRLDFLAKHILHCKAKYGRRPGS
ncbi:four-jointed box protein 1, partial [Fukomys damarensis]|uniref:four-jointed box protein 1 n=1 Tax=Fukomys damarensis TaxID=885580 RepID=UPI0008FF10AC